MLHWLFKMWIFWETDQKGSETDSERWQKFSAHLQIQAEFAKSNLKGFKPRVLPSRVLLLGIVLHFSLDLRSGTEIAKQIDGVQNEKI